MRRTAVIVLVVGAFVGGAASAQTSAWRVFATGSDSGDYGAFASASGDVAKPKGLAARVKISGADSADLSWSFYCSGEAKTAKPNVVYVVAVATSKKCSLSGTASTDTGGVTLQLLKR